MEILKMTDVQTVAREEDLRTGLNFLQVLFTTTRFSSFLSCEDLLTSSFHRSANIVKFSYI